MDAGIPNLSSQAFEEATLLNEPTSQTPQVTITRHSSEYKSFWQLKKRKTEDRGSYLCVSLSGIKGGRHSINI